MKQKKKKKKTPLKGKVLGMHNRVHEIVTTLEALVICEAMNGIPEWSRQQLTLAKVMRDEINM